jgi:hypothetical protein
MVTVCAVGLLDVIPVAVEYTDLACSCGDEEFLGTALRCEIINIIIIFSVV